MRKNPSHCTWDKPWVSTSGRWMVWRLFELYKEDTILTTNRGKQKTISIMSKMKTISNMSKTR